MRRETSQSSRGLTEFISSPWLISLLLFLEAALFLRIVIDEHEALLTRIGIALLNISTLLVALWGGLFTGDANLAESKGSPRANVLIFII